MDLIIGFIVFFAFLISGILLVCNKAHFLIAGFNTASKEDQEKYDKKNGNYKACINPNCDYLHSVVEGVEDVEVDRNNE